MVRQAYTVPYTNNWGRDSDACNWASSIWEGFIDIPNDRVGRYLNVESNFCAQGVVLRSSATKNLAFLMTKPEIFRNRSGN